MHNASDVPAIRCDGIYWCSPQQAPADIYDDYLDDGDDDEFRFLSFDHDGTLWAVISSGTVQQVRRWFGVDRAIGSVGSYEFSGPTGSGHTESSFGRDQYDFRIEPDGTLETDSFNETYGADFT